MFGVTKVFASIQGEGVLAGTPMIFIRFQGCNLRCNVKEHGFDCDTDFLHGDKMTLDKLVDVARDIRTSFPGFNHILFTGGEPMLQLAESLALPRRLNRIGFCCNLETNGTRKIHPVLRSLLNWVTCSPKSSPGVPIIIDWSTVNELRLVRSYGQGIPTEYLNLKAPVKFLSPAAEGMDVNLETAHWCLELIKRYPAWRLSMPLHKWLSIE